jgi:hypothetical protein
MGSCVSSRLVSKLKFNNNCLFFNKFIDILCNKTIVNSISLECFIYFYWLNDFLFVYFVIYYYGYIYF